MVDAFVARRDAIAEEITLQMGRPIRHSPGEVRGFEERARHMIAIAAEALAEIDPGPKAGFRRFIRREPLGVVLTIAPWNYPYLTAVNSIVPALLAGNSVILRHSAQTLLCAERIAEAFDAAGLPRGVFQALHTSHASAERLIAGAGVAGGVDFVAFTGSVAAGHAIQRAAATRFIGVGLELGGKDPAYVRSDAPLERAVADLADGAFFNAGQSCCGVERIYVQEDVYDAFVEGLAEAARAYRLGDPLDPAVTLGPMVRAEAADFVRAQTREAVAAGARALVDAAAFPADAPGTPYVAPQVLVDVDHSMRAMTEETFGPLVGVMSVRSDDEAVALMNDSAYGLTASVWTRNVEAAVALGERVETGTWFMNRCDYLDPALAWTGVKDSGRGCTLSRVGYESLTRPKSFHLRTQA
jgi:acyl-CoA reductase-like NAD-dependent aldehyde dehydrogenase